MATKTTSSADALAALRDALIAEGVDPDTADARLRSAVTRGDPPSVVGNLADVQKWVDAE